MSILLPIGASTKKVAMCTQTEWLLQPIFCEKTSKATCETGKESDANI